MSLWDTIGWTILVFLLARLLRSIIPLRTGRRLFESEYDYEMRTSPDPMCDPVRSHFDWRGKLKRVYREKRRALSGEGVASVGPHRHQLRQP